MFISITPTWEANNCISASLCSPPPFPALLSNNQLADSWFCPRASHQHTQHSHELRSLASLTSTARALHAKQLARSDVLCSAGVVRYAGRSTSLSKCVKPLTLACTPLSNKLLMHLTNVLQPLWLQELVWYARRFICTNALIYRVTCIGNLPHHDFLQRCYVSTEMRGTNERQPSDWKITSDWNVFYYTSLIPIFLLMIFNTSVSRTNIFMNTGCLSRSLAFM